MPDAGRDGRRTDHRHPVFARFYAAIGPRMEDEGMGALRTELLADVHGEVVEVGTGNGLNFAHYPDTVTHVTGVEPEPTLRRLGERAAATAPVDVTVTDGTAERLPLDDSSVDGVVLCLVLCSVDDPAVAMREIVRVLRPGGRLYFLEHMEAETGALRAVQKAVDATFWPLLAAGCHTSRRPLDTIEQAGLEVVRKRHLRFPDMRIPTPSDPHVLGAARRR